MAANAAEPGDRKPIYGIVLVCCAHGSGHAAGAPRSIVMKSRRLMAFPALGERTAASQIRAVGGGMPHGGAASIRCPLWVIRD